MALAEGGEEYAPPHTPVNDNDDDFPLVALSNNMAVGTQQRTGLGPRAVVALDGGSSKLARDETLSRLNKRDPTLRPFFMAGRRKKNRTQIGRRPKIGLSGKIFLSTCIRRRKAAIATRSRKEETGGSE
jgi:hypothetical protein